MAIVDRQKAEALIEEQLVRSIVQGKTEGSTFLQLARRLPNMTSKQTRIPVLDMLPMAYWVNGDTGMKQTTEAAWDNVYLVAGELAVIVPFPDAVLDDASFDIMGEIQPRITEAIYKAVDSAIIFGTNKPAEWQNDIITLARNAGNNVSPGSSPDYYELLMGEDGVIAKVEEDGYMPNGSIAAMSMRSKLRGIRTTEGALIFTSSMQGATPYALDGEPMYFPRNGSFDTTKAQLIIGDWQQAVYAIRQDITVKILTEGVIQDPTTKAIVYNLAQQDMTAIRVVFRMGWATPNPISAFNPDRTGAAWAYLEPVTPATMYTATFTVKDNAGTPVALKGAIVDVNGSRLKTDDSGKAVFNLGSGTYPVKVKLNGYSSVSDTLIVNGAAATKAITLVPNA